MVCVGNTAAVTVRDLETGAATAKLALPAWLAVMLQVPALTKVSVVPETVQTAAVVEANATLRPELAVASKEVEPTDNDTLIG